MPLYIISVIIQVLFVLHIVKTKRSTNWIWLVVLLPVAGSIVYFIIEIIPGLVSSRAGRTAKRKMAKVINPNKDMKDAATNFSVVETVDNSVTLAQEFFDRGQFAQARDLYQKCLTGVHNDDPDIMFGIAKSEFGLENYSQTKLLLDTIIEKNPDYKNPQAHLLFARTLEALNNVELALEEYIVLDKYYLGAEATYRYGKLLQKMGQADQAKICFDKIMESSTISGKHYNALNKEWIKKAKSEIN